MHTSDILREAFKDFEGPGIHEDDEDFEEPKIHEHDSEISEVPGHYGLSALIDFVGRRKI